MTDGALHTSRREWQRDVDERLHSASESSATDNETLDGGAGP